MSVTIKANFNGLDKKLSPEGFKRGRQVLAQQVGADSTQFVPMGPPDAGTLRNSEVIARDGSYIQWLTPYAGAQYYAPGGWNYTTPGTGPRWVERAKGMFVSSWIKAYTKGMGL